MKCGACKRDCRKTSLAFVAGADGNVRRARVCGSCFDKALHIVAHVVETAPRVDEVRINRRESASVVASAVKKLRGLVRAYERDLGASDFAPGLERAIDILEAGDF